MRGKPLNDLVFFPLIRFEPARAGIMINILEPELLGFYQLNDQINTGFYVLIMSILYVKLPDLFSLLKNKTQLKTTSTNLFYYNKFNLSISIQWFFSYIYFM